jgi:hypothetical protein
MFSAKISKNRQSTECPPHNQQQLVVAHLKEVNIKQLAYQLLIDKQIHLIRAPPSTARYKN